MKKAIVAGGALSSLILAGGLVGMVSAQTAATETGLTEEQIIAIALAEVAGEVQDIDLERDRGRATYEVEILTAAGAEMEVEVAAETGEILRVKADGEGCDKSDDA